MQKEQNRSLIDPLWLSTEVLALPPYLRSYSRSIPNPPRVLREYGITSTIITIWVPLVRVLTYESLHSGHLSYLHVHDMCYCQLAN
jgi:hypothetical protein